MTTSTFSSPSAAAAPSSARRELTRQYKDAAPPMGVYVIRNRIDQRVYIAASLNLRGAINRDRFELGLRSHRNKRLRDDWLRLGAENFSFEVIDTLKKHADPAFDYTSELASLLELWTEEFDRRGEPRYGRGR